jgi:peroxiredoxin
MLQPGAMAPDFPIGGRTLHGLLDERAVALFFFPKAFTPG